MQLTFLGHACFLLETAGKRIIFDPFITGNALADGKVDVESLRCDYVFLSHAHGDHVADVPTIMANNPEATIVCNAEMATIYAKKGYKAHMMNHGGWWTFDFGRVKMVAAVHSSTFNDGSPGGNPAGFVLSNEEGTLYFAGDTALCMDMQLIPMTCPPLTVAILPIGSNFTMDWQDAIIASDFVACNRVIGCHFDTFGYIMIDHAAAVEGFQAKGKELHLMEIGEVLKV